MKGLHMISWILVIIGGLNWGLTALGYNVVHMLLGSLGPVETIVYILVGIAAILEVVTHKASCRDCTTAA